MTTPSAATVGSLDVWIFAQDSLGGLDGALKRYRVMAMVVGVGLALLCFVGMPLQFGFGIPAVDAVIGPIHGFAYIIYLVFALDLARRGRFAFPDLLMMVGAGLIPIMAFVVERRVTRSVRAGITPWRSAPISAQRFD